MVGTTVGHYRIDREIGSGGMGRVYAAQDLRLHRQVAVKVLSGPFAGDAEFRQRFDREAQAVAALNHPNIVTIYSVEEADGAAFLTMELVDGRPLSDLIPAGGLPLERILSLAIPLADAVSAAHQRGITHRDLKPANIMVTADGRVKVLDFGLAKLKEDQAQASGATTLAGPTITGEGRLLGTVAYMSPEQAEGRAIDHRSDVFSLGIVLYEMATGERPFKGESSVSVMSAILRDTPPAITEVNRALPRDLGRVVRRCLMKDPEQRYQSAKDIRNDLQEIQQGLVSGEITAGPARAGAPVRRRTAAWIAVPSLAAIAALAAAIAFWPRDETPASPGVEATFTQLTTRDGVEEFPSLSPDGKWIVYAARGSEHSDIYLQSVGGQNPINLTKDAVEADFHPAFSPDGEWIAFRSNREGGGIFVMGRTGEAVRRITDGGFNPAWSPRGDEIVYASENVQSSPSSRGLKSALWIANVATGQRRQLAVDDAVQPSWSPNGHRIAFWAARGAERQRDILTVPAAGGEPVLVTDDAALDWNPVWGPDGRHLYFSSHRGGSMNIWRVPIDEPSGRVLGQPAPITAPARFAGHLSIASSGRLAYASIDFEANVFRLNFDPALGKVIGEPQPVTAGSKLWSYADPSPDGQWLVLASGNPQEDIYVIRPDGSGLRQLTNDIAFDRDPAWAPDGKAIAFYSNRGGSWDVWAINTDGSSLRAVTERAGAHYPVWAPDGARIAYSEIVDTPRVSLIDPKRPWPDQTPELLPNPADATWTAMAWSPDGLSLAGCLTKGSALSGVVVYSPASRSFTRATESGCAPSWLPDSRRLVFLKPGFRTIALVDVATREVRDVYTSAGVDVTPNGVSRDGRHLYGVRATKQADVWMATLK